MLVSFNVYILLLSVFDVIVEERNIGTARVPNEITL